MIGRAVLLRPALPDDALAVAGVHVRSWQVGYRGLLADDYLDGLRAEERARRYRFDDPDPRSPRTLVAVEGDEIVGFASTAPAPDLDGVGELVALYVDPSAWRRGVGRALIEAARARLVERGYGACVLWLLAGNAAGEAFYRADGWLPEGTRRVTEVWGIDVDEIRFRRPLP